MLARVSGRLRFGQVVASLIALALAISAAGCASSSGAANESGTNEGATTATADDGVVYFHGMSQLGFRRDALTAALAGSTVDLLAPSMSDAQIRSGPSQAAREFVAAHQKTTMSGYSLGRVPVLRSMSEDVAKVTRVVMIDPTYDSAGTFGKSGGAITRQWLDAADERTFMLVYGDVTKSLAGESSYVTELAHHPRATICYVPGDHERFRKDDMTAALVAKDCAELKGKLSH